MKKLFYLLVLCPFVSLAQPNHITTGTEFNYLTKGYAIDMAEGRDIKSGYRLDQIGVPQVIDNYTFTFSSFLKLDEKAMAAILVIAKSKVSGKTYYLCIPFNNDDLNQKYYNEILVWDSAMTHAYAYINSHIMSIYLANDLNAGYQK